MRTALMRGLNLLLPSVCLVCRQDISLNSSYPICSLCTGRLPLYKCSGENSRETFQHVLIPFLYNGVAKEILHAYKFLGKDYLSGFMANQMLNKLGVELNSLSIDYIIPIPSNPFRSIRQAYSSSALLSREVGKMMNIPAVTSVINRRWFSRSQKTLSKSHRVLNAKNIFYVREKMVVSMSGKHVLLVDDVYTTGASAKACAQLLKERGAQSCSLLAWAYDSLK